ncbi:hypothetical protein CYMTET_55897 [Cymbomonas tetramitiformis]|uniref:Response regulatory domain-containing protein n=1 Tax=Cymbomonas tetramitiformis TaxID=36881 RepID=A0AAE0BCE6_9CHLO|nr:hypothetical protein CYMTET_55897 [Cymbomonas tetramitiformis]
MNSGTNTPSIRLPDEVPTLFTACTKAGSLKSPKDFDRCGTNSANDTNDLSETVNKKVTAPETPSTYSYKDGTAVNDSPEQYEEARLRTLEAYRILDTPLDLRFEQITELAALDFKVPICLISLVDRHRQWFKSSRGLAHDCTDRSVSFCAHALDPQTGKLLLVLDASKDERFVNNDLVVNKPGIRFYAGTVLENSATGHRLGTLCVIDTKPWNSFDEEHRRRLQILADMCMRELEYHKHQQISMKLFNTSMQGNLILLKALNLCDDALVLCKIDSENNLCIVRTNLGWEMLTGYTSDESVSKDLVSILRGKGTNQRDVDIIRAAVDRRVSTQLNHTCYRKNLDIFCNNLKISFTDTDADDVARRTDDWPIPAGSSTRSKNFDHTGDSQEVQAICVMRDATESMRQCREDQAHKHAEAKAISRLLHDLKTPMSVAASVADSVIDALRIRDVEREDLSENVALLRTVARIASDRVSAHSVHKESVMQYTHTNCVATAIGCTIDLYKPLFSKLDDVRFDQKNYIPLNVVGLIPQDVIRRNLENLISNAIQFTYKGYVIVAYSLLRNILTIQVIDTGKGIPALKKKDIFSGTQLQYTSGGIGIGLQSVMHLSNSVRCFDNPEDHGSVFEFTVEVKTATDRDADPLLAMRPEAAETVSDDGAHANALNTRSLLKDEIRILLVEDDKIQLAIYKSRITRTFPNRKLVAACNGLEGLEMIRQHDFDVIISDFNMPVMDGASMFIHATSEKELTSTLCVLMSADSQEAIPDVPGFILTNCGIMKRKERAERAKGLNETKGDSA